MSLTQGTGPLGRGAGDANYTFESPAHKILFEPFGPRLRALVAGSAVLDTTRAHLLHETGIRPVPYAPLDDFDRSVMERSETSTHCPFKGDATYWHVRVGDRLVEDAIWAYEEPVDSAPWLLGHAAFWFDRADGWLVEDEPVLGHLRDPYHRVDIHRSSRAVRVQAGATTFAQAPDPLLLYETGLGVRAYLPRPEGLEPSAKRTVCPYKGEASYWHVRTSGGVLEDAAWSYEDPLPESAAIAGLVSFDHEDLVVEVA